MIICIFQLTSIKGKFQSQTKNFFENSNPFFIKFTVVRVQISEKKLISFPGLKSVYLFQSGSNSCVKVQIIDATKVYFQIKLPLVMIL